MRDRRLGTRAARAAILETLLQRGNAEREGKALVATDRGVGLIRVVDDRVKIPSRRGAWERAPGAHGAGRRDASGDHGQDRDLGG